MTPKDPPAASEGSKGKMKVEEKKKPGIKANEICLAPFFFHGKMRHFLASVAGMSSESELATVVFLAPAENAMKMCTQFLEGNCTFGSRCRFSHGCQVPLDELMPVDDTLLGGTLQEGEDCWVEYRDKLWYPGVVERVQGDEMILVAFHHYNESVQVRRDSLVKMVEPFTRSDSEFDSDEDEDDVEDDDDGNTIAVARLRAADEDEDQARRRRLGVNSEEVTSRGQKIADWERHTKGIGSKLLMRMGYKFVSPPVPPLYRPRCLPKLFLFLPFSSLLGSVQGDGLGKRSQGITVPIKVEFLGKTKSLDMLEEQRNERGKRFVGDPSRPGGGRGRGKRRKTEGGEGNPEQDEEGSTVFDFLNGLGKPKSVGQEESSRSSSQGSSKAPTPSGSPAPQPPAKSLNIQLVEIQRDLGSIKAEYTGALQAWTACLSKDSLVAKECQRRMEALKARAAELTQREKLIKQKLTNQKDQRGLLKF